MIDRVAASLGRRLWEVPVGFKWFVPGLLDGSVGFGGEESAGASFLRRDGIGVDDGQGRHPARPAGVGDPGRHRALAVGALPRADRPPRRPGLRPRRRPGDAGGEGRASARSAPDAVTATELAGEPITARLTAAPGNDAAIGGLKVTHRVGVVRRPAVGHRGRLQDLRRVVPGPRAPGPGAGRGPRRRGRCPGRVSIASHAVHGARTSPKPGAANVPDVGWRPGRTAQSQGSPPRGPDATAPAGPRPVARPRRGGVGAVPGSR